MPLVYPPNFEGVSLTYEYDHVYALQQYDPIEYAIPLSPLTGSDDSFSVQAGYCFYYFEIDESRRLRVCGFINSNPNDRVDVIDNPGNTYYFAYCGSSREGDGCFITFKCRMALNGTFSNPIYIRVFLEMGANYGGGLIRWEHLPICALLDLGQTQS